VQKTKFYEANDWRHSVSIIYGFEPDAPVNRSLNGQLTLDIQVQEDLVSNFEPFNFDVRMQESLVRDCDDLQKDAVLVYNKQVYCMLNDIKKWSGEFPYVGSKELRKGIDEFLRSDTYAAKVFFCCCWGPKCLLFVCMFYKWSIRLFANLTLLTCISPRCF